MSDCDTDDDSVANTSSQESINISEGEPVSVKLKFSSDVYNFIANDPCDDNIDGSVFLARLSIRIKVDNAEHVELQKAP